MTQQTFTAVLHKEQDLYVAECPEVGIVRNSCPFVLHLPWRAVPGFADKEFGCSGRPRYEICG